MDFYLLFIGKDNAPGVLLGPGTYQQCFTKMQELVLKFFGETIKEETEMWMNDSGSYCILEAESL